LEIINLKKYVVSGALKRSFATSTMFEFGVITPSEFQKNPNRLPPEFTASEQRNIHDFVAMANQRAQTLFADIRGLL